MFAQEMNDILNGVVNDSDKSSLQMAHSVHVALDALKISSDIGMLVYHQDAQALSELINFLKQLEKMARQALDNLNTKMN
jgi:hypothetical protein